MPARGMQGVLGMEQGGVWGQPRMETEKAQAGKLWDGSRNKEQLLPSFSVEGSKPISVPWGLALVWLSCPRSQQPWAGLGNPKAERGAAQGLPLPQKTGR